MSKPFKGLLSASAWHCVPDSQVQVTPTPLSVMGRGTGPASPGEEHRHKRICRRVRISLHSFPSEGGQDSSGCHAAPESTALPPPSSSCCLLCGHSALLSCSAADVHLLFLLQTSGLGLDVREEQRTPNEGSSGLRRKCTGSREQGSQATPLAHCLEASSRGRVCREGGLWEAPPLPHSTGHLGRGPGPASY